VRFGHYPPKLSTLYDEGYVDSALGSGAKEGYLFEYRRPSELEWSAQASPEVPGETGEHGFYVDKSGVIRKSATLPATADSPAL